MSDPNIQGWQTAQPGVPPIQHWQGQNIGPGPVGADVSPYDPDNQVTDGEIVEDKVYAVDAVTGDVYHGILSDPLVSAYKGRERGRLTGIMYNRDGNRPILARAQSVFNPQDGTTETYWYAVDCATLPPGAIPGEFKWLHLTSEV